MRSTLITLSVLINWVSVGDAQEPTKAQVEFFESKIRPALVKYCYECHSVEAGDSRAGLVLDSREGLLEGGDSGPAIVPGDVDGSLIWEAITWDGYQMPPSRKMPASVIADFKAWIAMGAPDPRVRTAAHFNTKITAADIETVRGEHWAFQPPQTEAHATIDRLVARPLLEAELRPIGPADAFTLLRRVSFDLTGLPPNPQEIETFYTDFQNDPDAAFKAKVDELLARPEYGQRWGRHWLDVARYAESSGSRNVSYPHAWRYRDYVIDAFNEDLPYDQFIAQQIAGDLLPAGNDEQRQNQLIATGFLAIGMKHHDERNPRKFMADMVDEQIDTVTQAMLGLTVACARCHDHKQDPIPTDDYYALAGLFYSTKTYYGTVRAGQNHRPGELLELPLADPSTLSTGRRFDSIDGLEQRIAQLDKQLRQVRGLQRRVLLGVRNQLAGRLAEFNPDGTRKTLCMGVGEAAQAVNANILLGGEVDRPAQEVPRGFIQALGDLNFTERNSQESGRLQLVAAITARENPLTARVMVNRIWMHLLGKPLVATPSNFGLSGMSPSNPELLDYLAVRFMQEDWSIKAMIREIVLSEAYRRGSDYDEGNYAVDPDNKLLWRANPRHLDAESLRDAMLALAGQLEASPPKGSIMADAGANPVSVDFGAESNYRSVYLPIVRDEVPPSMDLFGFPDTNATSPGRMESIVPTQALYMMNNKFVIAQASAMAKALTQSSDSINDQVRTAFLWTYGRPPNRQERALSQRFFQDFESSRPVQQSRPYANGRWPRNRRAEPAGWRRDPRGLNDTRASQQSDAIDSPLAVFCQTLMASAGFRILN